MNPNCTATLLCLSTKVHTCLQFIHCNFKKLIKTFFILSSIFSNLFTGITPLFNGTVLFDFFLCVFAEIKDNTVSLWSYANSNLDLYRNPLYWANAKQERVLVPIASIRHIKLWKAYYCRWNPSMRTQVEHFLK